MNDIGWKTNYFKSSEVFMLGYVCGSFVYPQFYGQSGRRLKMITYTYSNTFFGNRLRCIIKIIMVDIFLS